MSTFFLAIVVAPPPPDNSGAQTAQQGQCAYSQPLNPNSSHPTYQCLTQAQWDAQQAATAQAAQQDQVNFDNYWLNHQWLSWTILVAAVALLVVGIVHHFKKRKEERRFYGNYY